MTFHFKQWLSCLKQYILMCLFVSSPERLPRSLHCILLSTFAYCLLGFSLVDQQRSYATVTAQILLELGLLALVTHAALKWKKNLPRFHQTFSALIGVNLIISAVSIPLYHLLTQKMSVGDGLNPAFMNATMIIIFWNLAVLSLIFKRAFELNTVFSAMISFNYFLVYQFIVIWIT